MSKVKYPNNFFEYLASFDDDKASSGAWQAMIEEGVYSYNITYGTSFDTHDGFMAYVKHVTSKQH